MSRELRKVDGRPFAHLAVFIDACNFDWRLKTPQGRKSLSEVLSENT